MFENSHVVPSSCEFEHISLLGDKVVSE